MRRVSRPAARRRTGSAGIEWNQLDRWAGVVPPSPSWRWPGWLMVAALSLLPVAQGQRVYTPYTFTTIAGQADWGSTDGRGTAARFWSPWGVAADPAGNLWLADFANSTIRRVTPAGVVMTVAGMAGKLGAQDGIGSAALFRGPAGLALDARGNLIIADSGNHTIRHRTPDGAVTTLAGFSPGYADDVGRLARFRSPAGLALDAAGMVYVADLGNHAIRRLAPDGTVSTLAGDPPHGGYLDGTGRGAQFSEPTDVAIGPEGRLYVVDRGNSVIRLVFPDGRVSTLAGDPNNPGNTDGQGPGARFSHPSGIAVDRAGVAYVADTGNWLIRRVQPDGTVDTLAGGWPGYADGAGRNAGLGSPTGIEVDGAGNLYVTDVGYNLLRKITPDLVVATLAGSVGGSGWADGPGIAAQFYQPYGVAVDSGGSLYVVDRLAGTIRKTSPDGYTSTLAGSPNSHGHGDGQGRNARFDFPNGIGVDGAGSLYVTDAGIGAPQGSAAGLIRKITPDGTVTTLAGKRGVPGSADGTGEEARFRMPLGVAVDRSGQIYVADSDNHTIRRITPMGAVSTLAGLAENPGYADGLGSAARFQSPAGLALDAGGNLYVADFYNNSVRKVTPLGVVTTIAGVKGKGGSVDGDAGAVRFEAPRAVAVDQRTNVYVLDLESNVATLRRISPSGAVTTLAGGGWGAADGSGSEVGFRGPQGVAVDASGFLYVADTDHHALRKGWPGFWPILGVPSVGSDGVVQLTLTGLASYSYTVQVSPDFRHWNQLTNFVSTGTSTSVSHKGGPDATVQFYKASSP